LLRFLFFPPLRLVTRAEISGLLAAIWSAGRSYPPTRPWPASGQEAAGPESITGEVAPDELARGLALQLLLFTGLRKNEAGCLQREELDPARKELNPAKKPRGRTPTVVEIPEALRLAFEAWLKSNSN
jgi:integrase